MRPELFRRMDESPDPLFYALPRKVVHIDDGAIAAARTLYGELLSADDRVLDLMSSWRSHLPDARPREVVGLGMNRDEMRDNPQLDEIVIHDVNAEPRLPFEDGSFDAVVCTVSVQYLTRPVEVFVHVARVLRDGGPFVLTFSNRCFFEKAVAAWLGTGDRGHVDLVCSYFDQSGAFAAPVAENRSSGIGDPLYAVWARKQ